MPIPLATIQKIRDALKDSGYELTKTDEGIFYIIPEWDNPDETL